MVWTGHLVLLLSKGILSSLGVDDNAWCALITGYLVSYVGGQEAMRLACLETAWVKSHQVYVFSQFILSAYDSRQHTIKTTL